MCVLLLIYLMRIHGLASAAITLFLISLFWEHYKLTILTHVPKSVHIQWNLYKTTKGPTKCGPYIQVVFIQRFNTTKSICLETCKCGLYKQVIFIHRWSLWHINCMESSGKQIITSWPNTYISVFTCIACDTRVTSSICISSKPIHILNITCTYTMYLVSPLPTCLDVM